MKATSPLNIARNAAIKCGDLFRSCSKPGFAIFAKVGADNIKKVESELSAVDAEISDLMADGQIKGEDEHARLLAAHLRLRSLIG